MNHYYQRLIRTGASELTIADYQRQQLAVIYFVFLFHFLCSYFKWCCVERSRGSFARGLELLSLLFEFNLNVLDG